MHNHDANTTGAGALPGTAEVIDTGGLDLWSRRVNVQFGEIAIFSGALVPAYADEATLNYIGREVSMTMTRMLIAGILLLAGCQAVDAPSVGAQHAAMSTSTVDFGKATIAWTDDVGVGGDVHLQYSPTSGVPPWLHGRFEVPNTGAPRNNIAYAMGWNLSPSGGRLFGGAETAAGISFEQYYHRSGGDPLMEVHFVAVTTGDVQRRPLGYVFNRLTGRIDGGFSGERFNFSSDAGATQSAIIDILPGGGGQMVLGQVGNQFPVIFNANDTPVLYQRNVAGTAGVELIRVNDLDQVVVRPDGGPVTVPALRAGGFVKAAQTTGVLSAHSPPTVTGSRCDNSALTNLLKALAATGLIVDNTIE